jgi:hypothetical protein
MSKKSAKPRPKSKPATGASAVLSSQLKAIERLMEHRDYPTAARRLRALIEAHPDQSGPRRLLVEALEGSQGSGAAAIAAFDWAERRPKSLPAQEMLFRYALPFGQAMLSHLAACAASRLGEAKRARALCKASLERVPNFKPALESRAVIDAAGDALAYPPVFGLGQALPLTWLNRMRDAGNNALSHLGKVTASNDFLDALYVGGDDGLRGLVAFILQYRAERGIRMRPSV